MGLSGLGRLMVKEGLLSEQDRAIITKSTGDEAWAFAKGVIATGVLNERELASFLATSTHFRVASRDIINEAEPSAINLFPVELLRKLEALPLRFENQVLVVAMVDPLDKSAVRHLEFFSGYEVEPMIAPISTIQAGLRSIIPDFAPIPSLLERFLTNHLSTSWQQLKMKHDFHLTPHRRHNSSHSHNHQESLLDDFAADSRELAEDGFDHSLAMDLNTKLDHENESMIDDEEMSDIDLESDDNGALANELEGFHNIEGEDIDMSEDDGKGTNDSAATENFAGIADDLENLDVKDEFDEDKLQLPDDLSPLDEQTNAANITPAGDDLAEFDSESELGSLNEDENSLDGAEKEMVTAPVSANRIAALSNEIDTDAFGDMGEISEESSLDANSEDLVDESPSDAAFEEEPTVDAMDALDEEEPSLDAMEALDEEEPSLDAMEALDEEEPSLDAMEALDEDSSLLDNLNTTSDEAQALADINEINATYEDMETSNIDPLQSFDTPQIIASLNQGLLQLSLCVTAEEALSTCQEVLAEVTPVGAILVHDGKQPKLVSSWQTSPQDGLSPLNNDDLKTILNDKLLWRHLLENQKQGWIIANDLQPKSMPRFAGTSAVHLVLEDFQNRKVILIGQVLEEAVRQETIEDLVTRLLGLLSVKI